MYAVLAGAGISTGGDCRLIIFEEISARLSYNYNALVLECNAMNKNYTDAIEEWAVRYAELEDQLGKAEKKKGTATAVAIGTGTLAVGSGIYNIIQNREKKDLREANKELSEKASDDLKVKIEQCQKLGKDYDMISGECVDKIKIDIKNN
jgi:hypothetical protein